MVHYSRVHGAEHEQDRENVPDNSQVGVEEAKRGELKVKKKVTKTEVEVKKEAEVEKMVTDDKPAAEESGLDQQRQTKTEGDASSTKMEVDEVKREEVNQPKTEEMERPPSKKQKLEKREEWVTKTPSQPHKVTSQPPKALPQPPTERTKAKSQPLTSTPQTPKATSQPQKVPAQQPPKSSEPELAGPSKAAPPKMGKIQLVPIPETGT